MNLTKNKIVLFFTDDYELSDTVIKYLKTLEFPHSISVSNDLDDFTRILNTKNVLITLADQKMGSEDLIKASNAQKKIDSELPLVIITEKNRQEEAARLLLEGAGDYVTTDNLKRLGPVLGREIRAYNEVMKGVLARQEIRELKNIIDSAEDEIYILNGETYCIDFANKKALKNLGYEMNELYGKHIQEIAEEIMADSIEVDRESAIGGRTMYYTKFIRKDGTRYSAEAFFQTSHTEGKTAILGIVHDVTERDTVKQHAFVLDKAIDASASAVSITDCNFKIVYTNKTFADTSGKTRNALIGRNILEEQVYANSGLEFLEALKNCKNGESWVGEYQKTGLNDEELIVLGSISPVTGSDGEVSNIVIVEEDITERVKIKTQLLHAQKMETVGELTSGIAHDFTNMLTAIGGFSSIMKRKMDKDDRFYTYVDKIYELTIRAKNLTKNLLTFSRKTVEDKRVVSVNALVRAVGEFLSMVIGSRLELDLEFCEEDLNVIGDPVQLEQVIINLATNARDAIDENGKLVISTDRTMLSNPDVPGGFREYAVIKVTDNGCGIEPDKAEMIFEPFFTTKREGKGTGLGLYIVKDIIDRHKGVISCNSILGEGTEFEIKLPVTDQLVETTKEDAEVDSSDNICILLVEDEKIVRESLAHALDIYGYKTIEAENGREALDIFAEKFKEIDLVITDIVMPVMNGIKAYSKMLEYNPDLKIIFTTGYVGEAHRKDGFREEDHIVMIKPIVIKELVKKVEAILST